MSLFKLDLDNLFGQAGLLYEILRPTNTGLVPGRVHQSVDGLAINSKLNQG